MKTKWIILSLLVLVAAAAIFHYKSKSKEAVVNIPAQHVVSPIPTSGEYCFARIQKATADAPYSVEEHVVLNFDGVKVKGTKKGTQSGPDMTNGYEGTLEGSTIDDEMELTYAYTIEGSKNRELEVYTFVGENLVKKRWVLKEQTINKEKILVPDYKGEPMLITYTKEECAQ